MNPNKYCTGCETLKLRDQFYGTQTRCKPCHNSFTTAKRKARLLANPKPKKEKKAPANVFHKLEKGTQEDILKHYGAMPLTKVASKFNINKHTLRSWKLKGFLTPAPLADKKPSMTEKRPPE
jgi:hypothetical protein